MVKDITDKDVQKALREGGDMPEGTVINFYTQNKMKGRTVDDLIASATQNSPGEKSGARTSKKESAPTNEQ